MFYSTKIFKDAGLVGLWPFYATIAMGAINVAQTIVSLWLVDHPKFGRRSLHLIGLSGMLVSSLLIVVSMVIAVKFHARLSNPKFLEFRQTMGVISLDPIRASVRHFVCDRTRYDNSKYAIAIQAQFHGSLSVKSSHRRLVAPRIVLL